MITTQDKIGLGRNEKFCTILQEKTKANVAGRFAGKGTSLKST